jgi:hypothetical protein
MIPQINTWNNIWSHGTYVWNLRLSKCHFANTLSLLTVYNSSSTWQSFVTVAATNRLCDNFTWSSILQPVLSQPNLQLLINLDQWRINPMVLAGISESTLIYGQVPLHVLPLSSVSIIPPLLHTHSFIYHPRCIMFFSQYFSFSLSLPFHQCSILIHLRVTLTRKNGRKEGTFLKAMPFRKSVSTG